MRQEFSCERLRYQRRLKGSIPSLKDLLLWLELEGLKEHLGTPARIYFKCEGVLPTGSREINTAIA